MHALSNRKKNRANRHGSKTPQLSGHTRDYFELESGNYERDLAYTDDFDSVRDCLWENVDKKSTAQPRRVKSYVQDNINFAV